MAPRFQEAERNDPFRNFNFRIVMGGEEVAACRKMSMLEVSVNTVKFRAGNSKASDEELIPGPRGVQAGPLRVRADQRPHLRAAGRAS